MNVKYEKKLEMTFIGYHTEIRPEEGYQKCPEFWDKEFAAKYARLWQTMKPETEIEKAISVCLQSVQNLKTDFCIGLQDCIRAAMYLRD